jgi:hypothetical protein
VLPALTDDARRWALALIVLHVRLDEDDLAGGRPERHQAALQNRGLASAEDVVRRIAVLEGYRPEPDYLEERLILAFHGLCAGYLDEATAWPAVLRAAFQVRAHYDSWRGWAEALGEAFLQMTDFRGTIWPQLQAELANPVSPWNTLPWDVELLPMLQRFAIAIGAPVVALEGGDPRWLGGREITAKSLEDTRARTAALLRERYGIEAREALVVMTQELMHDPTERALPLARIVALAGYAARCGLFDEPGAWQTALVAQLTYPSWEAFGDELVRTGGAAYTDIVAALHAGPWSEIPWDTDLQVVLATA